MLSKLHPYGKAIAAAVTAAIAATLGSYADLPPWVIIVLTLVGTLVTTYFAANTPADVKPPSIGATLLAQMEKTARIQHGGTRATGGPVSGDTPYIVGERGPEMWTPGDTAGLLRNGYPVEDAARAVRDDDDPGMHARV